MGAAVFAVGLSLVVCGGLSLLVIRRVNRALDAGDAIDKVRDEVNRLVVELNRTADRNIGIVEERIGRLQRLLGEADRKIALLGRETERHDASLRVYDTLKKAAAIAPTREESAAPSEVDAAAAEPAPAQKARKTSDEVMELHRQGIDARIIASKLGATIGEVELIISLQERKR